MRSIVATLVATALLTAAGTAHAATRESIGTVDFGVSCSKVVRGEFDRAVALLHHMMYRASRSTFEAIAREDPDCAMARWGIAITLFQPLWPTRPAPDDLERGRKEIAKAEEIGPEKGYEKKLVAATKAFFAGRDAKWADRIREWARGMKTAYHAHPDHADTAAFFALSRLAIGALEGTQQKENARAVEVLLAVREEMPAHPGTFHYTIHANDIDGRASENLGIVRGYADIAPSVPHALHMPTHIFVRLGLWQEVIDWNRKSAAAALHFPAGEHVSHHYPHAMDYLVYAYLQRGEDNAARKVLEESLSRSPYQPSFISAFHLSTIPARYAVERRAWKEAAKLEPRTPESIPWDAFAWAESLTWFARGLGAAHVGNLEKAKRAEKKMTALRDRSEKAGERQFARYIEIDRRILAGHIGRAQGKDDETVELLRSAAELEAEVQKHPVAPGALLPPNEALGELLLELGHPAEALAAFEASDDVWPRRFNTLAGAVRAASAAGKTAKAEAWSRRLAEVAPEPTREMPAYLQEHGRGE